MKRARRALTLRRELVLWYTAVLVAALGLFAVATHLLLQQALERAGRASLRQTAQTVEQLTIPPEIERLGSSEEIVRLGPERVEALRRRTRLETGEAVEIYVARNEDVERHALRSFLLIALLLIPITAVAAAAGGQMLLDRLLFPLHRFVDATREIGIGGLSRRVHEPQRPAELRELAQSFNEMMVRLERAVDALRRFTADASHELRTPLTSIKGTIQVALARPRSADELEDTLAQVAEEAEWMLALVDGLLLLARGEEGGLDRSRYGTVNIIPLLHDAVEIGEALALDRPLRIRAELPPDLRVAGSPGQLRQVFLNLVSNAVKFTESGEVRISAEVQEGESGPEVVVRVRDTGVGIAPDELERVFDRFYRADAARSRSGGMGLGLAIARLLVEQHGGRIEVESTPGTGSEFRIVLPRQRGDEGEHDRAA